MGGERRKGTVKIELRPVWWMTCTSIIDEARISSLQVLDFRKYILSGFFFT